MKKQLLLSMMLIPLAGLIHAQNLIRVNNNPDADADYMTLQEANDNASDGDIVYLEGSTSPYEGAEISRQLVIIGPGYFLTDNDSTQANGLEAVIQGYIYFQSGSEGSTITGCNVSASGIYIYVDDIIVSRCQVYNLEISDGTDNILITQNYTWFISFTGSTTNSIISNNFVKYYITANASTGPLQVINNVMEGVSYYNSINVFNSGIANNIVCDPGASIVQNTGNVISNNILAADGTNSNGNQYNVVMANVFVDFSGTQGLSQDGKWMLKPGSPAIGAGISGADCGMYGGVSPYVLSGLPPLPRIYEASIPGAAYSGEGLPVTIKVKAGK